MYSLDLFASIEIGSIKPGLEIIDVKVIDIAKSTGVG